MSLVQAFCWLQHATFWLDPETERVDGQPEQMAPILADETYPGELNVAYTRGLISSQAFVDRYKDIASTCPRTRKTA